MAAIAPMDLLMKTDPASIPLKCNLCPKKPNFSDVSHLLTHISSKSHLSHRFKTELKAHREEDARETMRQYDDWYERYGIGTLLADRLAAKDKKTNKRGRSSTSNGKARPNLPKQSNLVKAEPQDFLDSPAALATSRWPTTSRPPPHPHSAQDTTRSGFKMQDLREGYADVDGWHRPSKRSSSANFSVPSTPNNAQDEKYLRWPSPGMEESLSVIEYCEVEIDDAAKLKGVRYPGMGLFDAASEHAKKRRNQRKDESVLKQMELTSEGIEPTEFIWNMDGELERTRDIYASPSVEGSPDRKFEDDDDDDFPRKKKGRGRIATGFTAGRRSTRYSSRIAKRAAARLMDEEDDDASLDLDDNDTGRGSSHVHGSVESYDVFQDRPKHGGDGAGSPGDRASFDLRRRSVLHPLNPNSVHTSEAAKAVKLNPYLPPRDDNPSSFSAHSAISNNPYLQQQVGLGTGTYNPLYVQTRNGYFHPYSYSSYGTEVKAPTPNFQSINTAVNPSLAGLQFPSFQTGYTADSPHHNVHGDFGL